MNPVVRTELATSRYANRELIVASGLAPIQITIGRPRMRLGYELAGCVGMLAPYGLFEVNEKDEFTRRFRERLEGFGVDKIGAVLVALANAASTPGVVLLCFEDLTKPGEWCHRRVYADWWEEKTGQHVPELE